MTHVNLASESTLGKQFIPDEFLPSGKDEYYIRNEQNPRPEGYWRHLRSEEIEQLVKNGNTCPNWDDILVREKFNPQLVSNCQFFGPVRIGTLQDAILEYQAIQHSIGAIEIRLMLKPQADDAAIEAAIHENLGWWAEKVGGKLGEIIFNRHLPERNPRSQKLIRVVRRF